MILQSGEKRFYPDYNDFRSRGAEALEDGKLAGPFLLEASPGTKVERKNRGGNLLWNLMLMVEVIIYSSYGILVHLSKDKGGHLPFKSSSVVLCIEFLKLLMAAGMYFPEFSKRKFTLPTLSYTVYASFCVPAVLYTFNNNMALHMQLHMDPVTYQVLGNLKIGATGLLYRCIIRRELSSQKWFALGLLMLAGVCDSFGGFHTKLQGQSQQMFITLPGLVMILSYCMISGFAAVYTEYILKKHLQTSLHLQNFLLYSYGVVLNSSVLFCQMSMDSNKQAGFLTGFTVYTWIIVITQAANGLVMSVVMKHGSNITRLFIISAAMLTSTLLSMGIFGTMPNIFFLIAAVLVVFALYLHNK